MIMSKVYFTIGIIGLILGASMIHLGLGIMLSSALVLFVSYMELKKELEDNNEE